MKFSKMNGLGNDYIYINLMNEKVDNPGALAKKLSDRNFGVGADGIVLIDKSVAADFSMRMFNADGSEGEMCGNAVRCVGKYVYDKGLTHKKEITISTLAGIKTLQLFVKNNKVDMVRVNMGAPSLNVKDIPVLYSEGEEVILKPIMTSKGKVEISCVSVGNPHAVIYIDDIHKADMDLGKEISENTSIFPNRVNVGFVEIKDDKNAYVRVYERGAGETLACGTGATAAFYISYLLGKLSSKANMRLKGGTLFMEIMDGIVFMTGNAEFNYEGEIFL